MTEPTPICDFEAEQALLGCLLTNPMLVDRVADFVEPRDFDDPTHARLYATILLLVGQGQTPDPRTLRQFFAGDDAPIGGPRYLADLAAAVPSLSSVVDYGRVVRDLAVRRRAREVLDGAIAELEQPNAERPAHLIVADAISRIDEYAESSERAPPGPLAATVVREAEEAARNRGGRLGLPTGLTALDRMLSGLVRGNLIVVGGRPGAGKSNFAVHLADVAASSGANVRIASFEMTRSEFGQRLLSRRTGLPFEHIRDGRISADQVKLLDDAAAAIDGLSLVVDDERLSMPRLRARVRAHARRGLDLLIVDHIQLTRPERRDQNRVTELDAQTADLKETAKRERIPIVALSQLSRYVEQRDDKRPLLSDLRESGGIEQNADVVLFLYREAYYAQQAEPSVADIVNHAAWRDRWRKIRYRTEILVRKNRHGRVGNVEVWGDPATARFADEGPADPEPPRSPYA